MNPGECQSPEPFPILPFPRLSAPWAEPLAQSCAHTCACDFGGIGLGCLASMPVSEQDLWDSGHGRSLGLCVSV